MTERQKHLLRILADPAANPPGLPFRFSRAEREAIQAALNWIEQVEADRAPEEIRRALGLEVVEGGGNDYADFWDDLPCT